MIRATFAALLLAAATAAFAQEPAPSAKAATTTATVTPATTVPAATTAEPQPDSRQTRDDLREILRKYPPQLGMVLKLDPTLFNNPAYMANYPALTAFVERHPEVVHNSPYFLAGLSDPETSDYRSSREIMGDIAAFSVFLVITFVVVWLIKTVIEQRRWTRLSTLQSEVNSRLLDRFATNEELLAYLQSDAGRKFLAAAPLPLEGEARPMSAPLGRIFFSVQAGLVMIAGGIGFDLVSLRTTGPGSNALYGVGVIALLVGIALVLSAALFYVLSKRFGLWSQTAA